MKVKYILPIDNLRGCIGPDYYARVLNGQKIIQRRPNREKQKPTAKQKRTWELFKKRFAYPGHSSNVSGWYRGDTEVVRR